MSASCASGLTRPADREVLLVGAHGGADHLRRQVQEGRVHVAQHRGRPFCQAGDFFQKALVFDQFQIANGGRIQHHHLLVALLGSVQRQHDEEGAEELRHRAVTVRAYAA